MFSDINERNCWEAGEGYDRPDFCARVHPTVKDLKEIEWEFNEMMENIALRWFSPDELEMFNDDDWWSFRERIGI